MSEIDQTDRRIIEATQGGIPIVRHPYAVVAEDLGLDEAEVIARLQGLIARGVVRRIAAAANHYALGMAANGMTVWDVADEAVTEIGRKIGALDYVTHCYQRPRDPPDWPYNLFAMVHGATRDEVEQKRREIAVLIGHLSRADDILYSKRILKKTGVRLTAGGR
ncbi:MAG: AsnC family transcriptional regulator [Alphaproteobacteria bacterium]|nr:AsnC family transcriptional regulator [Alphaproteobacteria bacterium]